MSGAKKRPGVGIDFTGLPPLGGKPAGDAPAVPARPATGVGLMSVAVAGARELQTENARLQAQVQQLEGERGAQLMAPRLIRPSRWANRHETSFKSADFEALKTEIADAGGNVQPVKVRPLQEPGPDGARYELVFGHRRHRACLELGLPVLAIVAEVDEQGLWVEMERENRGRANLSAWEQGVSYRRALDAGLFPSQAMLARAIGRAAQDVSEALRIASLPAEVVAAFRSPNDIQFRWAKPLADVAKADPKGLRERALAAASDGLMRTTPAKVFAALVQPKEGIRRSDAEAPAGAAQDDAPRQPDEKREQRAAVQEVGSEAAPAPVAGLLLTRQDSVNLMAEADLQAQRPGGCAAAALLSDVAERIAKSLGEQDLATFIRQQRQRHPRN